MALLGLGCSLFGVLRLALGPKLNPFAVGFGLPPCAAVKFLLDRAHEKRRPPRPERDQTPAPALIPAWPRSPAAATVWAEARARRLAQPPPCW